MGRTYWIGPPKWKCPNCGKGNRMKKSPASGHSVKKKCSGCGKYVEVEGSPGLSSAVRGALDKIGSVADLTRKRRENKAKKVKLEENSLKGEEIILKDKYSDYDGEQGTVTDVWEDMFGDKKYTISFADGEIQGVTETDIEELE